MDKCVWITRTRASAAQSEKAWHVRGMKTVIAPLLDIVRPSDKPSAPPRSAALIFTSQNAVYAFQAFGFAPINRVFTVGDATAKAAHLAGFKHVMSAGGAANNVTDLVIKTLPLKLSQHIPIIHCGGKYVRGQIAEGLQRAGYNARRDLYYQSEPVSVWPELERTDISHIAIYSPLAAKTFAQLLAAYPLNWPFSLDIHELEFISISQAADEPLGDIHAKARHIAQTPNEAAMLACL